jgi:hypothetical protein
MTLAQFLCGIKTRHAREMVGSAGTHSLRMECVRCGRIRIIDIDTGARPVPFLPEKHSLAPKLTDRWGK